jgi:hypothetical protein
MVSEKSITRQQAGRFRRAKNDPSARRSLAGDCSGHKILESRDEGELGYASLESKSEIPAYMTILHCLANEIYLELLG